MLNDRPKFQIISIVANELDLWNITLPISVDALTKNSSCKYEVIAQVDGATDSSIEQIIHFRDKLNIDEVRIRNKANKNFICPGDPSNNAHFHALSGKSDYTIEIESDVIAVLEKNDYDALGEISAFFDRHPETCLISSVIDYDCWVWKLEDIGRPLEKNVRDVNRVSSHFLVYHNQRFLDFAHSNGIYNFSKYTDDCNYEDVISNEFVKNNIPIAFFENWAVKVRHCDEKQAKGSIFYKRDKNLKIKIAQDMIRTYSNK
ncbi:MAG: hypothetical protein Q8P73_04715 [bacterium]|nr:hypothetical protein [bacterium]